MQTGKFQKVEGAPKPADDNAKTRKFNAVSVSEEKEKTKEKNRPTKKILIAVLSLLLIGGLTAAALIIFRRPPEEVKIVPTDVVAGVNETSDNVVSADLEAAYSAGEARHTVRFTFYEKPDFICTTADIKAGDLMRQLGIEYENDKIVSLRADDSITSDVSIEIKDVTYDYDYETEAVANETVYVDDPSSYQGTETVAVEGYTGVKTYTYKVTLVNGTESERELVSEEITTAPQNRVIYRGTKVIPATPHSTDGTPTTIYTGVPENYLYYIDVRATCYYIVGTTATGLPTGDNVMAVDPSVIPLGSECVVIGEYGDYGHRIAADVGGGIKGNIIDIWLPAGTGFGWQNARVYVLREGF